MRLGWHVHLLGPFYLGGTIWQSKRRRRYPIQDCGHAHRTKQAYVDCKMRTWRRTHPNAR